VAKNKKIIKNVSKKFAREKKLVQKTALAFTSLITVNNCNFKLNGAGEPEVSQVTEKTLKPIKVRSEKELAWSRELGKRSQEFKRAKKLRDEILEESVIENHVEVPEVLDAHEKHPKSTISPVIG
jgi:hypothetical protein